MSGYLHAKDRNDLKNKEVFKKECDVFGRTCYDEAMKNPQLESENPCPHCLHDCEFIKFKKQVKI